MHSGSMDEVAKLIFFLGNKKMFKSFVGTGMKRKIGDMCFSNILLSDRTAYVRRPEFNT